MRLTPFFKEKEAIDLVPAAVAIRLRREEGHQEVPAGHALWLFNQAGQSADAALREFVLSAGLCRLPLTTLNGAKLRQLVCRAIQKGEVVPLRRGQGANKATDASAEQRRLVRQIEKQTRGPMMFAGHQYRLVADVELAELPDRDNYEVPGRGEAQRVLDGLAKQAGAAGDLAALLGQAKAKLAADWRPPFHPEGLILLRRILARAATAKNDEPAMTPSQMKALVEWDVSPAAEIEGGPELSATAEVEEPFELETGVEVESITEDTSGADDEAAA